MYKVKIFNDTTDKSAAIAFNEWSEMNPEFNIIDFNYKITEMRFVSICILYEENSKSNITLGNLIEIIRIYPCCTIYKDDKIVYKDDIYDDNSIDDISDVVMLSNIIDHINVDHKCGKLEIYLK